MEVVVHFTESGCDVVVECDEEDTVGEVLTRAVAGCGGGETKESLRLHLVGQPPYDADERLADVCISSGDIVSASRFPECPKTLAPRSFRPAPRAAKTVTGVACSGSTLCTASLDKCILSWQTDVQGDSSCVLRRHAGYATSLCMRAQSDASSPLLCGAWSDGVVTLSGRDVESTAYFLGHESSACSVALSAHTPHHIAAGGGDGRVLVWDITTQQRLHTIDPSTTANTSAAVVQISDPHLLYISGGNGVITRYDTRSDRAACVEGGSRVHYKVYALSVAGDGTLFAGGGASITVHDARKERPKMVLTSGQVVGLAVSPTERGTLLAAARQEKQVQAWDPVTGTKEGVWHATSLVTSVALSDCGEYVFYGDGVTPKVVQMPSCERVSSEDPSCSMM